QKWLGIDIEYGSTQVEYYKKLDQLLDRANHLSQKLQIEIQKSQARYQQLTGLREQMAKYISAAEAFLMEYPKFVKNAHSLDNFVERLSKKINSLQTLQSSNDIAITQMQLSQQLSLSLLDRYKEAQQVLIPAWQYHVKQSQQSSSTIELEKLDNSREKLIHTLKKSLQKPTL
ncbi:MAG: tellurium resistance protein, partial [Acinetobacter sp.]